MGATNTRLTPRQKMINLMYIVLTAMLALNVSSDVLDGFTQVHEGLNRSNENVATRNQDIYHRIELFTEQNPEKGKAWLDRATQVRLHTAHIYKLVDSLKLEIVRQVDGENADPNNIENREDLEAAAVVMLAPGNKNGEHLRLEIDRYRQFIVSMLDDPAMIKNISKALATDPIQRKGQLQAQLWEEAKFDQQPVVAAVTLLSKLQNDILYAEGEALSSLLSRVDSGDLRVNSLEAFVIPQSRMVMRGGQYQANIVLAAIDTTARPEVYVNGKLLTNDKGLFTLTAGTTGTFTYRGYIKVPHGDGTFTQHDFSSEYTVIEPMATVSATMMNVLYAGIDNPISISVPGVAMNNISATMSGGSLTRSGDHWIARPTAVGGEATVSVTATIDGRSTQVATSTFRVRRLPDPVAYIAYSGQNGAQERYKGSKPFSKSLLLASQGLDAAIDDGLLDTKFKVLSFETVMFDSMGNAMPEVSAGSAFSQRQRQAIQRLSRGKRFFITRIKAVGPDGITRELAPLEVIIG